jgi:uncharacterized protein YabN with tetrapyrrole methylase and pyrophosphatase domain
MGCLRASNRVFLADHGLGSTQYLLDQGIPVESLLPLYVEGQSRLDTYREMAARVLTGALDFGPVAFATYGHPCFYVYPTQLILAAAPALGLRVHVAPGVSVLDTLMVDLGLDPGLTGLQVYEASACLQQKRVVQNDVPLLLMQVATLNRTEFSAIAQSAGTFEALRDYLLAYYPATHEVVAVTSPTHPLMDARIQRFPIAELPSQYTQEWQSGTLYVPAIGSLAAGG